MSTYTPIEMMAVTHLPCPHAPCAVAPGQQCTAPNGKVSTQPHRQRMEAAEEIWAEGMAAGQRYALTILTQHAKLPQDVLDRINPDLELVFDPMPVFG